MVTSLTLPARPSTTSSDGSCTLSSSFLTTLGESPYVFPLVVEFNADRQHGQHHAATGHMTRDQVFVPRTRSQLGHPAIKEDEETQGIRWVYRALCARFMLISAFPLSDRPSSEKLSRTLLSTSSFTWSCTSYSDGLCT